QNRTPLRFRGQFYTFDLMTPFFNPGPIAHPKIPIFIAGVNQYMCRMAGEVCDGLHVHPLHTAKYLRDCVRPAVEEGLRASGRSPADFTYAAACFVVVGDTEQERAREAEAAKQQIAFYASTRTYEPVLAVHGWEAIAQELHERSLEGDWAGMTQLITDEMLETFAVTGTYEDIGRKLRERYTGLLDRVTLYQPHETLGDESRLAALVKEFGR
ncbi:MAG TPA: LLM class flavin-dependent oxidoreductase, partial [Candidatus Bathyarchaeia archaeon]|nr:LLM class flavin-dependent oxidoreductase [Candidatus Bathyarchaeia archaeon]